MTEAGTVRTDPRAAALAAALLILLIDGLATDRGALYQALDRPSWHPPGYLFLPAWALVLGTAALGVAAALQSITSGEARQRFAALLAANVGLNIAWGVLFFRLQRPDLALADIVLLWLSIAGLIALALPWSRRAALLVMPYLAWVAFAGALNLATVRLNGPF